MRGYADENATDYFGVATIVQNMDSLYEPKAVMALHSHPTYLLTGCEFMWDMGWEIAFAWEEYRYPVFSRMYRMAGMKTEILEIKEMVYAGRKVRLCYGKISKLNE